MLAHIESDGLEPGFNAFDFARTAHLALQIGNLFLCQIACVHLEPAINLSLVHVRKNFASFVQQWEMGY